jgi:hypothetical protein
MERQGDVLPTHISTLAGRAALITVMKNGPRARSDKWTRLWPLACVWMTNTDDTSASAQWWNEE